MKDKTNRTGPAAELRRKAEALYLEKGPAAPENPAALPPEELKRVLHELGVHQIELELQNEELRRAQAELDAQRARYFELYDLAPTGYLTLSEKGVILEGNLTAAALLGEARNTLPGRPFSQFIQKEDQDSYYLHRKQLLETGRPQACELRLIRKDGTLFWARLDANAAGGPGTAACRVALNDITAHKQDEEALRFANTVLSTQSEASIDGILVVDAAGTIISFNRRFIDIWGISPEVIASKSDERALRSMLDKLADPEEFLARVKHLYAHREEKSREEIALLDNRFLDRHSAPMLGNDGRYCGRVWYFRDITGRKRAEAEREEIRGRLLQAQKMDAVGVLAGGVAHDFNNILTVARSYAEFIYKALPPESPMRADAQEILTAADRAAAVTRQLLAFSRKQMLSPRVTDINTLVVNMTKMLKRLLGEDIELTASLAPVPCQVMADPGQIEQMIMNLVVNTRDALPKGGTVTLETALVTAPEMFTALPGLSGGPVVRLRVRDNGCGMPEEVKRHIFEPFYTTKAPGKGTGLGLATVFGIVKQSGGEIDVESEAGKGTVFSVYLPLIEAAAPDSAGAGHGHAAAQGHETVLLVEDDETLRRLGERLLKENGYAVIAVSGGQAALEAMERHGKPVDLLLSDVIMPGMNGRDLALELQRRKLAGRVLYMSGYTNAALARHGVLEPGIAFIYKPFTADALAAKLREALDGPADKAKA